MNRLTIRHGAEYAGYRIARAVIGSLPLAAVRRLGVVVGRLYHFVGGMHRRRALSNLARALPEEDLLFLPMDITRPEVVSNWAALVEASVRFTVLAMDGDALAGYGSLHRQETQWTRHLGEIRIIVGTPCRGTGLGGLLAREILEVARDAGLSKIVAQMPRDQAGARSVFRKLGFDLESMLADWVIDTAGNTHDLVIMAYEVDA